MWQRKGKPKKAKSTVGDQVAPDLANGDHYGKARSLSDEEIQRLYPGVEVNRKAETSEEFWERMKKSHAAKRLEGRSRPIFKR